MNDEDFDFQEYRLTDEGARDVLFIISEFCHGFTIEEIAANRDVDPDYIKSMMLVLSIQAGIVSDGV